MIGEHMSNLPPHCGYVAKNNSGARFATFRDISALFARPFTLSDIWGIARRGYLPQKGPFWRHFGCPLPLKFRRLRGSSNLPPGAQKGHYPEPYIANGGPLSQSFRRSQL